MTFAPTAAISSNFNVVCLVKKKPSKLTLNVKGEGYAVHDSLQIEGADGRLVEVSADTPNQLDFGQVCSLLPLTADASPVHMYPVILLWLCKGVQKGHSSLCHAPLTANNGACIRSNTIWTTAWDTCRWWSMTM